MHDPLPLLAECDFPPVHRARLETLQINVGYRCNQSCVHCHVNAGPNRTESMQEATVDCVIRFLDQADVHTLDITGGAPELNPYFRMLVKAARERGIGVIDRCNLTILEEPEMDGLAEFLAENKVRVVGSLPCYLDENVDRQRGKGVFATSIAGLRRLNRLGYGTGNGSLRLDLVYNPQGPTLPPPQKTLEDDYKQNLGEQFGVSFDRLLTLANMPVGRFGSALISRGEFETYLSLLKRSHDDANLPGVMCRSLISVDWKGYVYDCDFNQMLDLPMRLNGAPRVHLSTLVDVDLTGRPIVVRQHCYGCTAGQGSSCGGALI